MKVLSLFLLISTLSVGSIVDAADIDIPRAPTPAEQLRFVDRVEHVLQGFRQRIDDYDPYKLDPYTDFYSNITQQYETIVFLTNTLMNGASPRAWTIASGKILDRIEELDDTLSALEQTELPVLPPGPGL